MHHHTTCTASCTNVYTLNLSIPGTLGPEGTIGAEKYVLRQSRVNRLVLVTCVRIRGVPAFLGSGLEESHYVWMVKIYMVIPKVEKYETLTALA